MYTIITRNPNNPNTYGQIYTVNVWAGTDVDRVVVTGPNGKIDPSLHLTTTLNGVNSVQYPVQFFANASGGTSPNWISAADTHTLNIPMASISGVTAGLWSNVDYNRVGFKDLAQAWDLTQTFVLAPVISNPGTNASNASTYGQLLAATTDAAIMSKLLAGYVLGTNKTQLVSTDSIVTAFEKTQLQLNNKEPLNTGLLSGGVLSINVDNTKFDIGNTVLYFSDFSNPAIPTGSYQVFNALTGITVTNIATQNATYVGINSSGTVIQQGVPFTPAQSRSIVSIGAVIHSNRVNINTTNNIGASSIDPVLQTHDLMLSIGALNVDGNVYSTAGANLSISKSQGTIFKFGSNFQSNHDDPHTLSIPFVSPVVFRYRLQNSTEYANTPFIDPNNYDLNGVLTSVPANKFTVQRISLFQSGLTRIQYGQALYSSLSEAISAYLGEVFTTEQNIKDNSILRGYLIVGQGTTSLLDDTKVKFFDVSKFGHSVSYNVPNEHIDVNNTDVALSGIKDKVVTISNILATRNLFLPPATIPNQIIRIVDESGNLSPTSYLHIVCAGSDIIETNQYTNMTGPYDSIALVSNGAGRWDILYRNALLSAGIQAAPSYTDNNNGTVTVGTGFFNLYRNPTGLGSISAFSITGTTYTPVDGATNYIVADYNNGSPILRMIQDVTLINETTIIPVLTVYRGGTSLHILEWDNLGLALTNKMHQSIVKTQRYRRESGLGLGETGTRNVTVAGGAVWTGAVRTLLGNFNSTTDNIFMNYHVAGVWTVSMTHQYENLYYDNGTDRIVLNPNRYAVNYVYIGVESRSEAYITLGTASYGSLVEAVNSQPGPVPPLIASHAILVGRIIVLQGANVATQIDSAFVTPFTNTLGGNHNDLAGLQGGVAGQYFHLTNSQYTNATQNATSTLTGLLSSTDWNTFNGKQAALNGTGFVKVVGTTVSYDNTTYAPSNQTMFIGTTSTPINRASAEQALTGITSVDGSTLTLGGTTASSVSIGTATTTQVVNIGTGSGVTTINLGGSGDTVNIAGTLTYVNTTNLQVTDKLITVNKGGSLASGDGAGLEVEENSIITGFMKIGNTRSSWVMQTPAKAGTILMTPSASAFSSEIISSATANRTFNLPDSSGTLALTTDGVTSFNTRVGAITLTSLDVTNALTYTPVNKAGDTMTGALTINTGAGYTAILNSAGLIFNRTALPSYIQQTGIGGSIVIQTSNVSANDTNSVTVAPTGATTFINSVTASSFIKTGGTSSQFLKADGSVDSTAYTTNVGTVTSVSLTTPLGLSVTGSPVTTSGTLAISFTAGYSIPTTSSQNNWDTAYTDRFKWDGGPTGLVAATGRTSLGATTVGSNLFTLANPSAISYIKINADNSVSTIDATTLKTSIGAESSLGNPAVDGYSLVSTALGVRSWAAMQPLDADLTAIAALAGTSGLLRKTAADTWSLDTTAYGTVTTVSIVSANGISGTVANASTTPAITLTLGVLSGTSFNLITGLGSANPLMAGTAAPGTATLVSRQDHVHPVDTSRQAALNGTGLVRMAGTVVSYDNNTYALNNQTFFLGTTSVAINRVSGAIALTGITSIDGNAATATNVGIIEDVTTATAVYPTWVTTNTGNLPLKTTSTKLSFVPSTGILSATGFSGSGANLTGIPESAITNLVTDLSNKAATNQTFYLGTTLITINRASANISLTGINSIDGVAAAATNVAITDDVATATTVYPTWVAATSGNAPQKVSSSKLSFVPSTGVLTTAGLAITGTLLTIGSNGNALTSLTINAAAASSKTIVLQSDGVNRWVISSSGAETGSDAGSTFNIGARSDAGGAIDNPISIVRATGGAITFSAARSVSMGALTATSGTFSGSVSSSAVGETFRAVGATTGPRSIRFANTGGDFYVGVEDATGAYFGAPAYSSVLYSANNLAIRVASASFGTSPVSMGALTATGASTFTSSVAIGPGGSEKFTVNTVSSPQYGVNAYMGVDLGYTQGAFLMRTQYATAPNASFSIARSTTASGYGADPSTLSYSNIMTLDMAGNTTLAGSLTVNSTIYATGDVIAYYSSDRNLKENIRPITNAISKVKLLNGITYNWNKLYLDSVPEHLKEITNRREVGLIAQDVEIVLPELVSNKPSGYKGIKYDKIVALLVEAIKEQQIQIDNLRKKV